MRWRWLGTVDYGVALERQRAHRAALIEGSADEELWLLEHPPVVTTGRRVVDDLDPGRIESAGYAVYATERGGLATVHEPGQLVGYLLFDARALGVRRTVEVVEEAIGGWLRERGLDAGPRAGFPGVWVGKEKVCAIGLHFRNGRTMHGFALNLTNDLRGFGLITPCGIQDGGITTVARLAGGALAPREACAEIGARIVGALLDARRAPVNRLDIAGT